VSQAAPYDRTGGFCDDFIVSIICIIVVREVERTVEFAACSAAICSLDEAPRFVDSKKGSIAGSAGRMFKPRCDRTGLGARVRRKAVLSGNPRD